MLECDPSAAVSAADEDAPAASDFPETACARCPFGRDDRACATPGGRNPPFCPTVNLPDTLAEANAVYLEPENLRFAQEATRQARDSKQLIDGVWREVKPRVQETVEFCLRMGYRHLGLAFCGAVRNEARIVSQILEANGFEVTSVMCKVGCTDKSYLGLGDSIKRNGSVHESLCNNINQALILNKAGTEFNIMMGLCVGHDALFLKYAEAPTTVLIVKDRMLGNNPVQALYLADSFFSYLKKPLPKPKD